MRDSHQAPVGLNSQEWVNIRQQVDHHRHAAVSVEGAHEARNPGQRWQTRFDGRGFLTQPDAGGWQWGLELRTYGFPGHERAVAGQPRANAEGQRVTYDWDDTLQEWFVNDRRGLEHGFTLRERPAGLGERLLVTLAVRGSLRPEVLADGRGVRFMDAGGAAVLTYTGLTVFDADGRSFPARFESVAEGLRLAAEERGARYPLTIDHQAYLKASNTGVDDSFGYSVAMADGTVVIGAPFESSNATGVNGNQINNSAVNAGAAYVFVRSGTTWRQQAYLKASNTEEGDGFGNSVAISGDTVVIGAGGEDSNATGVNGDQSNNSALASGAAYVFVRTGTNWSQQAYLKASNTGEQDGFGSTVAVSGDTVVAGAWRESSSARGVNGNQNDNSAGNAGAAYMFVRNGTNWSQQAYLKASNTGEGDFFGHVVALSGDTVVVTAPFERSAATGIDGNQTNDCSQLPPRFNCAHDSGAAYVFVRSGTTWTQQAYLKASNTDPGDQFGTAVALSGDTLVVGADKEDSSATGVNGNQADYSAIDSGAAYVFVRVGTSWRQQAYLKASNTGQSDNFGYSVAVSDDTVVVGAW